MSTNPDTTRRMAHMIRTGHESLWWHAAILDELVRLSGLDVPATDVGTVSNALHRGGQPTDVDRYIGQLVTSGVVRDIPRPEGHPYAGRFIELVPLSELEHAYLNDEIENPYYEGANT